MKIKTMFPREYILSRHCKNILIYIIGNRKARLYMIGLLSSETSLYPAFCNVLSYHKKWPMCQTSFNTSSTGNVVFSHLKFGKFHITDFMYPLNLKQKFGP